ncbi:MAG: hypothetical protein KDA52_05445 [Planctomycetaceae bacterium]|nr:hypothetical protein [Planctomycetaceae bacterium]
MAGNSRQKRDDALVIALARGETIAEAARVSGWSERTVQRRLDTPYFIQQVRETRSAMVTRASGRLADAAEEAVRTLRDLLTAESESVKLSAAKSILEMTTRFRDAAELEERLTRIEEKINERLNEIETLPAGRN